jgi:glyoxylase-like metal-dependent hydrolase (beta-lactamase superfamily II)
MAVTAALQTVVPGLYASPPGTLPFDGSLAIRAFLVQRDEGNVLLYRGDPIEGAADEIDELGGVDRQYLNHRHEASPASDRIAERFDAPLLVHRDDAEAVSRIASPGAVFFDRHGLDSDLEVIPTPGHTPGATAYLWDSGRHRALFTGDTIFLRGGEWVAAVLASSDRESYLESLELIRGLEFDVLVPWAATAGDPYFALVDRAEAERRIDAILVRLDRGEDR